MRVRFLVAAVAAALVLHGSAAAEEYISTFSPGGTLINTFAAGVPDDQLISFLVVDANGDIWIGRIDNGHGTNQFSPNDEVIRFSPTGTELQVVKGPTRYQTAIGFDSSSNIYIGAIPDGGALGDNRIYRFSQSGTFDTTFGSLNDTLMDLAVTAGDRIFAVTNNVMTLQEYSTGGALINNRQVNNFLGRYIDLDGAETTLWCYQDFNGPGVSVFGSYDLNLIAQSSFDLNPIGDPGLGGLEVLASGNLLTLNAVDGTTFYELTPAGAVVDSFSMPGVTSARKFTLDNDGNIVVTHSNALPQGAAIPALQGAWLVAFAALLAGASILLIRRGVS
jgi:hypothetical protein